MLDGDLFLPLFSPYFRVGRELLHFLVAKQPETFGGSAHGSLCVGVGNGYHRLTAREYPIVFSFVRVTDTTVPVESAHVQAYRSG